MADAKLGQAALDEAFKDQISGLFLTLCKQLAVGDKPDSHTSFRNGLAIAQRAHQEASEYMATLI